MFVLYLKKIIMISYSFKNSFSYYMHGQGNTRTAYRAAGPPRMFAGWAWLPFRTSQYHAESVLPDLRVRTVTGGNSELDAKGPRMGAYNRCGVTGFGSCYILSHAQYTRG